MPAEVVIEGATLRLARPSDVAVAQRVAAHFQRRIAEDDWRPGRHPPPGDGGAEPAERVVNVRCTADTSPGGFSWQLRKRQKYSAPSHK